MITILIVDDEVKICEFVQAYLRREGYNTLVSNSGNDAIKNLENNNIDLIILDRKLPDISGDEICQYIREKSDLPIIMITSKDQSQERIEGFKLGCDDYICKPFNPEELVYRVKAMLKRCKVDNDSIIRFKNGLEINKSKRSVTFNGNDIDLTKTEYDILIFLSSNPDKIYTREEILFNVIEESDDKLDRSIDNHIKNIRKKFEDKNLKGKIIKTVYGVGYRFEE